MPCQQIVLYSRDGCHLCDAFEAEFTRYIQQQGIHCQWRTVSVDQSPELLTRYGDDVPVLTCDDNVICQHFFDPLKIQESSIPV